MVVLLQAMAAEQNETRFVNAAILLYEGTDGSRTAFFELLKTQQMEDCISMEKTVMGCIDQLCNESGATEVSVAKLREALMLSDANKTRMEINQLLARGAGCTLEEALLKEAKRVPLSVADFKTRIRSGLLKKSPRAPPKKTKR